MDIKIRNIVRKIGTNEVYEVENIIGQMLLCKPINTTVDHELKIVPLKASEVEVLMDQETDAFNILFKHDDNS